MNLIIGFVVIGILYLLVVDQPANALIESASETFSSAADWIGVSTKVSVQQLTQYAQNAGFTGDALTTAVAVALAESGGNPEAYNPETVAGAPLGQGSYGLWQVYLKAHPEFSAVDLYDPQANANAAFAVYTAAGNSFSPWTTFKFQTKGFLAALQQLTQPGSVA